ncbi:3'-5' exoribonuclease YhaM [Pirellula sp. SH-Sr6A]|uniref:3'-5' exoribonuclease YhaM family protein n=1 Tax=Pirellula sp. SH-Sr6A TaxID=1632865 RepID=UPI00078D5626|nr:HDIG domain-containing metalloprotein [Pirellula sp. SH-Sr6A]AMV32530.1 3'-5' exoribonuclease YhaM [Pirellula sp. SH-Sr6A]
MPRTFISDIQPQMQIDEVFRIADRQLRANRQGGHYLLLQLQDRTGTISGMRWNADERIADKFQRGAYVRVQAASQLHNGVLQLIVHQMQGVEEGQIEPEDFESATRVDVPSLWNELRSLLDSIQDPTLRAIAQSFVTDPEIEVALKIAPAGIKTHHAYPGGLLEHIVSLVKLASALASHYAYLDRDILLAGAFLHDIGKLEELAFDGELTYTDAGQLIGHLVQGVGMVERKAADLVREGCDLDPNKLLHLKHIIVSHHGCLEHGSPKVPMTMESMAFHYIDEMDAKLSSIRGMIEADRTRDTWTPYNPSLARKILKPLS